MRRPVRIMIVAVAAVAALWVPRSAVHASPLPCQGYGGQGAGGYVSSLVNDCLQQLGR